MSCQESRKKSATTLHEIDHFLSVNSLQVESYNVRATTHYFDTVLR